MASLEEFIETIDQDIANQNLQLDQLRATRLELIESYNELVNRIIIPTVNIVDAFIDQKLIELRGSDPIAQWRIFKQTDYHRDLPMWHNTPSSTTPLTQYPVSSLGNVPSAHIARFGGIVGATSSSWRIEEDTNYLSFPTTWVTRYNYNDVISENITEIIEANEEYFYAYDLICQRPVVFDGTYGLVEKINSINRALYILTYDKEKLDDTKTFVTRIIDKEG